jgi:hypothetical protein
MKGEMMHFFAENENVLGPHEEIDAARLDFERGDT